jgi:glycine oxidase
MPSVIVIGAGVVGATIAWELAAAGARVRLIDARTPGDGATRASAGVLAPYIEGHPASPLRDLGRESLDLYDDFIARLKDDSHSEVVYERSGTLEVALTVEEAERLGAESGALFKDGVEARWVPPALLPEIEPGVSPRAEGGLLVPMHGYVGVSSLTAAAVTAALGRGAQVMVETGAITVRASAVPAGSSSAPPRSTLEADRAVLAAGSWSSRITIEGADAVPMRPIRGQLLQLAAPRGLLRRVIWGTAGYLVPWPDGSVLVGATVEDVGFDEGSTQEARRGLMAMASALVPGLRGNRPRRCAGRTAAARPRRPAAAGAVERRAGPHLRHGPLSQRRAAGAAHGAGGPPAGVRGRVSCPSTPSGPGATGCSDVRRGAGALEGLAAGAPAGARRPAGGRAGVSSAGTRSGVRGRRCRGPHATPAGTEPTGSAPAPARRTPGAATDMATLTATDIERELGTLTGWTLQGSAIRKEFSFEDFPEAVLFVSALVPAAETANHHPDIAIHYNTVTLSYSTHSEGG